MKTSTFIIIGIIAVFAAYFFGRYFERLTILQSDVSDMKLRVVQLEKHQMRSNLRREWLQRIASHIPIIKGFLTHKV